jgi:hypothetical protein
LLKVKDSVKVMGVHVGEKGKTALKTPKPVCCIYGANFK